MMMWDLRDLTFTINFPTFTPVGCRIVFSSKSTIRLKEMNHFIIRITWILVVPMFTLNMEGQNILEQSTTKKPDWYSGKTKIESQFFQYFVGHGSGMYIDSAKLAAIQDVLLEFSQNIGTEYLVGTESYSEIANVQANGQIKTYTNFEFKGKIKGKEQSFSIPCLTIVEYYWEKVRTDIQPIYHYWVLTRVSREEKNCNMPFNKKYGGSAVWRSALIPGWGQIYKHEKIKGYFILGSEVSLIATALVSQYLYSSNYDYANKSTNPLIRQEYFTRGDNWASIRTITAVSAVAVYLFNVIDAIASKGKKRYSKVDRFQILPNFTDNRSYITLKINL